MTKTERFLRNGGISGCNLLWDINGKPKDGFNRSKSFGIRNMVKYSASLYLSSTVTSEERIGFKISQAAVNRNIMIQAIF